MWLLHKNWCRFSEFFFFKHLCPGTSGAAHFSKLFKASYNARSRRILQSANILIWVNQPIHSFLGGKGLGIQQGTSVRVGSPQPAIFVGWPTNVVYLCLVSQCVCSTDFIRRSTSSLKCHVMCSKLKNEHQSTSTFSSKMSPQCHTPSRTCHFNL